MIDPRDAYTTPAPVPIGQMTSDEQIRQQTGPGTEGLPGFVVIDPGPGGWYFDDDSGEWKQEEVKR